MYESKAVTEYVWTSGLQNETTIANLPFCWLSVRGATNNSSVYWTCRVITLTVKLSRFAQLWRWLVTFGYNLQPPAARSYTRDHIVINNVSDFMSDCVYWYDTDYGLMYFLCKNNFISKVTIVSMPRNSNWSRRTYYSRFRFYLQDK